MNGLFKLALEDKIAKWGLMLSFIFFILEIAFIGVSYFSLPPLLPLFNQLPWGSERLGTKFEILTPVLMAMMFMVFNFVLGAKIYEKAPLLARMLSITTLLASLLSFIFVVRTIYLLI